MNFRHWFCLVALSSLAIAPACGPTAASPTVSVPTAAATPASTSAPTDMPVEATVELPTFTPRPTSGVGSEALPDGSTIFYDFDNGYAVTLPAGWTVVPLNGLDMSTILDTVAQSNPGLPDAPTDCFGDIEPETIRAIALYPKEEFVTDALAPNIGVVRIDDALAAKIPMNYLLPNVVSDREKDGTVTGSEIRETADGLQVGVVNVEADCRTPSGATVPTVQRVGVFQTGNTAIAMALMVQAEFADELLPAADDVISSIKLLQ